MRLVLASEGRASGRGAEEKGYQGRSTLGESLRMQAGLHTSQPTRYVFIFIGLCMCWCVGGGVRVSASEQTGDEGDEDVDEEGEG